MMPFIRTKVLFWWEIRQAQPLQQHGALNPVLSHTRLTSLWCRVKLFDRVHTTSTHPPLRSHHKLALKAITGVSSVVASVAIYHQAAFMLEWYTTAGMSATHHHGQP